MVVVTAAHRFFDGPLLVPVIALAVSAGCGGHPAASNGSTEDAAADATPEIEAGEPDAAPAFVAVPLSACVPSTYTLTVTIGGTQQFQLSLDTGSTTLGVASSMCTSCGVTPLYEPGPKAVDENQSIDAVYGSGSWTGEIYQDSVTVGSEPATTLKFGAMDAQDQFFIPTMCDSKSGGIQGIIGFGPEGNASPGTVGYFDQLVASNHVPNVFATELCDTTGTLWLGGYDSTFTTAAPKYTSLSASMFSQYVYAVSLPTIEVDGMSIPVGTDAYPNAIVDTGTSNLLLSTAAFSGLTTALASNATFTQLFGGASFFNDTSNCVSLTQTKDELDAALPSLTLTLGSSPPITIQALPTESYLIAYEGYWCPTLVALDPTQDYPIIATLGSPVLRSNIVIFDLVHQQIGFAPHKTCS